ASPVAAAGEASLNATVDMRARDAVDRQLSSQASRLSDRLGVADAQALDAPRVGVDHFERDAGGMGDELAAGGHASGERHDEAAQGVDVLGTLFVRQHRADAGFKFLDGGARIRKPGAVVPLYQTWSAHHVVLVLDLADHLLNQILEGDEAVDAAELIDH